LNKFRETAKSAAERLDFARRKALVRSDHTDFKDLNGNYKICNICFRDKNGIMSEYSTEIHIKKIPSKVDIYSKELTAILTRAYINSKNIDDFDEDMNALINEWIVKTQKEVFSELLQRHGK
jgi:hypothetical protein